MSAIVISLPVTHILSFVFNWCMQSGWTALHFAVDRNRESMLPLLLEHKADVDIQEQEVRELRGDV